MTDPKSVEVALVYRRGERVGRLERTRHGSAFEYDPAVHEANRERPGGLAVHLPWAQRRIETGGVNLHSYFAGLLPEGIRLEALIRAVKTSSDDLFSLLIAAGRDCIGDLAVLPEGVEPGPGAPVLDVERPEEVEFQALLEKSLGEGVREIPIPGVQEKLSAAQLSVPVRGLARQRRAYLLKLDPPGREGLVTNEWFFMTLARQCGLETANVRLISDRSGRRGLLVERFDRVWDRERRTLRELHQEDGCQLVDRYPADKYRLSCADLAGALEVCAAPVPERLKLLRLIAFSYLIGNGDLHGKNVSVFEDEQAGGLRLTPAYDLLSTLPYGDRRMALKLDGKDDGLSRRMFVALGGRFGVLGRATERMLDELCARVLAGLADLEQAGLDAKKTKHLREVASKRARELTGAERAR